MFKDLFEFPKDREGQIRNLKGRLYTIGWVFVAFGSFFLLGSVYLLVTPESVIRVNGEPTTAVGNKIAMLVFSLVFIAMGYAMTRPGTDRHIRHIYDKANKHRHGRRD